MTRICIISPEKDAYSETFVRAHVERLPAEVRVLYGGAFPRYRDDGALLLPRGPLPRRARRVFLRTLLRFPLEHFEREALRRFLKENEIKAVLAEYGATGVAVSEDCRMANVPLIVHFHGYDAYRRENLENEGKRYPALFRDAAAVIAVSHDMEKQLLRLGADPSKLHYNPCGVNIELFPVSDAAQAPPLFISVGRFVDKKAPHLTLLAFKWTCERCPEAKLIMIGDGPLLEACRQMARALGLEHAVEFPGAVPHPEVAAVMRRARAFVQHSLRADSGDSEGTPVAVSEAQAAGLPVVATRHGGIVDVVVEGETGFLVDEGDVRGMTQRMLRLAREPELAAQLGKAGSRRVRELFSMEKSISNLWRIIENAIQRSQGQPENDAGIAQ